MKLAPWTAVALMLAAGSVFAARPTSIIFETNAETTDGQLYGRYTVRCDDGRTMPLTAWDGHRKWCVGDTSGTSCTSRQIAAAKSACEDEQDQNKQDVVAVSLAP
jgi:hypothetical protein